MSLPAGGRRRAQGFPALFARRRGFRVVDLLDSLPRSVRFLAKDGDKPALLRDRLLARWIGGSEHIGSPGVAEIAAPETSTWTGCNASDQFGSARTSFIALPIASSPVIVGEFGTMTFPSLCVVSGNAVRILATPVKNQKSQSILTRGASSSFSSG
jgi:hypothetical protein